MFSGNRVATVTYALYVLPANKHGNLVRQADQMTLLTDINVNIIPYPLYNYAVL